MVEIPAGSFQMGNYHDEFASPVHEVNVESFGLAKFEVTRGDFAVFIASTGFVTVADKTGCGIPDANADVSKWTFSDKANWRNPGFQQSDSDPVVCVTVEDSLAYIEWLNELSNRRYRLPTEAEWEYACRANSHNFHCGQSDNHGLDVGWNRHNSPARTQPVGLKPANGFGLYDMSGNAYEWTTDCWNDSYHGAPTDGSPWLTGDCERRVIRGGSWASGAWFTVSAMNASYHRNWASVETPFGNIGFRLASER